MCLLQIPVIKRKNKKGNPIKFKIKCPTLKRLKNKLIYNNIIQIINVFNSK